MWSKDKVIQTAQYHINLLRFHFTSMRPTIPEIELFRNLTLKHPRSRLWVRSKVIIMVMNGWLTSFSFHVNRPSHSSDKAISDSDLEISTPGSRSWVWSRGKVIQLAQYHINSLRFHFKSIRPIFPEIYFEIWPWNIQCQGHEWGQRSMSHIVLSIQPMHLFTFSHQSDQPFLRYGQNSVSP